MSWRFRKRLKILPGIWVNLSKRGGSLSVGHRGATMNISPRGHQESVGLPGSGLSYRTKRRSFVKPGQPSGAPKRPSRRSVSSAHFLLFFAVVLILLWILAHVH